MLCLMLHRALEAILIITTTTLAAYVCCMLMSTCVPIMFENSTQVSQILKCDTFKKKLIFTCACTCTFIQIVSYEFKTLSYFCPEADDRNATRYHNDFATLILNRGELSITQIFHLKSELQ